MRAIVTGGLGFIGSVLVKKLKEQGWNVEILDIKSGVDIKKRWRYLFNYKKADVIFHLAAIARIPQSFKEPFETMETNSYGTLKLAQHALDIGAKVVYASTSAIDGDCYLNPYVYSKWIGEKHFKLYNELFGLNVAIARFYNVYGEGQENSPYKNVVPIFKRQYKNNVPLTVTGDGKQKRDFIHVDDICNGLTEISKKELNGEIFNLGMGTNISINELASYFSSNIKYIKRPDGEMEETLANLSFTNKHLNWKPKINIKDYIKDWKNNS